MYGNAQRLIWCALADALEEGAHTITFKHLEGRAKDPGMCFNILKKTQEGEKRFEEMVGSVEKLRQETGLDSEPISRSAYKPAINLAQGTTSVDPSAEKTTKSSRRRRGVGQRSAKRDPVGNG